MMFPKFALNMALLAPFLLAPAYARGGGGGGHSGGGGHVSGGHFNGGGRVGGSVGVRGGTVVGRGFGGGFVRGPNVFLGFGGWDYPYYGGYYGYDPYYYGYDPYVYAPDPAYAAPPASYPQQQTQPQQQPQAQVQSSNGSNQGNYYLVAFTDHTIQATTAYKVDGDQFHWITRDGKEKQVPLSSVDVPFSQQLNRDRHVEFQIP